MKLPRIAVALALLAAVFLLGGCNGESSKCAMVVYIDGQGDFKTADGGKIDPLWVFRGDRVAFVNTSDKDYTITFESTDIFGVKELEVPMRSRREFTVLTNASTDEYDAYWSGPPGGATAKVGDDP